MGTEVTPSSICFSEDGEMMFTNLGLAANAVQWCTRVLYINTISNMNRIASQSEHCLFCILVI